MKDREVLSEENFSEIKQTFSKLTVAKSHSYSSWGLTNTYAGVVYMVPSKLKRSILTFILSIKTLVKLLRTMSSNNFPRFLVK